jgi:hypothetical protein
VLLLLLLCAGGQLVSQQLLDWLAQELYAAVARVDPRWDVVPCLECAGWTQGEPCAQEGKQRVLCLEGGDASWRTKRRLQLTTVHPHLVLAGVALNKRQLYV